MGPSPPRRREGEQRRGRHEVRAGRRCRGLRGEGRRSRGGGRGARVAVGRWAGAEGPCVRCCGWGKAAGEVGAVELAGGSGRLGKRGAGERPWGVRWGRG